MRHRVGLILTLFMAPGFSATDAPGMRRLTHSQYNHTVHDLLGDQTNPANQFSQEDFVNGFRNQTRTDCQECVVRQLFRYGCGRHEIGSDSPVIWTALIRFRDSQFRFKELMISLMSGYAPAIKLPPRRLLKSAAVAVGLPPLEAMFNPNGTPFAAETKRRDAAARSQTRFVLWFNGNGITERYWIPTTTGPDYEVTPCLAALAPFRNDIHVITGLDNPAAGMPDLYLTLANDLMGADLDPFPPPTANLAGSQVPS